MIQNLELVQEALERKIVYAIKKSVKLRIEGYTLIRMFIGLSSETPMVMQTVKW